MRYPNAKNSRLMMKRLNPFRRGGGGGAPPQPPQPPADPLAAYYSSGAIGIHFGADAVEPAGGPVTKLVNKGAAGPAVDATVVGTAIPLSDNALQVTSGTSGYPQMANPADIVGVRFMWVMDPTTETAAYRIFGSDDRYIRTVHYSTFNAVWMWDFNGGSPLSKSVRYGVGLTGFVLFELEVDGPDITLFVNGTQTDTISDGPFTSFLLDRLTQGNSPSQSFDGKFGDVLGVLIGHPDYAAAVAAARTYLTNRFNI